jgi:serine/threonine protein kinase
MATYGLPQIQIGGAYYGDGGYGCVIDTIDCLGRKIKEDEVVKILEARHAKKEFESYDIIREIDPNSDFTLELPILCNKIDSNISEEGEKDLKKCSNFNIEDDILVKDVKEYPEKYSMLIMKYGGQALDDIENDNEIVKKLKLLWNDYTNNGKIKILEGLERLFIGVNKMLKAGVTHNDIKPGNILLNVDAMIFNMIDFGLLKKGNMLGQQHGYYVNIWAKVFMKDIYIKLLFDHFHDDNIKKDGIIEMISQNMEVFRHKYSKRYAKNNLPVKYMDIKQAAIDLYDLAKHLYLSIDNKKLNRFEKYNIFYQKYHTRIKEHSDTHMLGVALFRFFNILIPDFKYGEISFSKWSRIDRAIYVLLWRMITHNYVDKSRPIKTNGYNVLKEYRYILDYLRKNRKTKKNNIVGKNRTYKKTDIDRKMRLRLKTRRNTA